MPTKKQQVHRLEDLLVEEVSIVDRPANKRPFLLVKSEAGHGAEVVPGAGGELVTDPTNPAPATNPATPPAPPPSDAITSQVEKALTHIEKALTLAPEVRRQLFQELSEGMRKIHAVMNLADAAPTDYEGKEPSALAPLFASELSAAASIIDAVGKRLAKLAKNDPDPGPDTSEVDTVTKALNALVEGLESKIEKRGAKMSAARLGKFKDALGLLHKLLEELDATPATPADKGRTAKDESADVAKAMEDMTSTIERLGEKLKKQAQEIRVLKEARPAGNAIPVDSSEPASPQTETVRWPRDMNRA